MRQTPGLPIATSARSVAARLTTIALQLGSYILIVRVLDRSSFGLYAIIAAGSFLTAEIVSLQAETQAARSRSVEERGALRRLAARTGPLGAALFIVVAMIAGGPESRIPSLIGGLLVLLRPTTTVLRGELRATGNIDGVLVGMVLAGAGRLIGVAGAFTLLEATPAAALVGDAAGAALHLTVVRIAAGRAGPTSRPLPWRRLARTGSYLSAASIAWLAIQRTDVLMLGAIEGRVTAGSYEVALRVTEFPVELFVAAMIWYLPSVASVPARELLSLTRRIMHAVTPVAATAIAGVAIAGPSVERIVFGRVSGLPQEGWMLLAIGLSATLFTGPAGMYLAGVGADRRILLMSSVAVAANITCNALLIPPFGAPGAAGATALSLALLNGWAYVAASRHLGGGLLPNTHWTEVAACLAASLAGFWLLPTEGIGELFVAATIAVAASLAVSRIVARRRRPRMP